MVIEVVWAPLDIEDVVFATGISFLVDLNGAGQDALPDVAPLASHWVSTWALISFGTASVRTAHTTSEITSMVMTVMLGEVSLATKLK